MPFTPRAGTERVELGWVIPNQKKEKLNETKLI